MDTNHVFSRHSQHCLLRWVHFGQHEIRIQYELPLYYNIIWILIITEHQPVFRMASTALLMKLLPCQSSKTATMCCPGKKDAMKNDGAEFAVLKQSTICGLLNFERSSVLQIHKLQHSWTKRVLIKIFVQDKNILPKKTF